MYILETGTGNSHQVKLCTPVHVHSAVSRKEKCFVINISRMCLQIEQTSFPFLSTFWNWFHTQEREFLLEPLDDVTASKLVSRISSFDGRCPSLTEVVKMRGTQAASQPFNSLDKHFEQSSNTRKYWIDPR